MSLPLFPKTGGQPKIKICKICGATESPKWDGRVCRDCKAKRDSDYYQAKRAGW